MAAPHTFWTDGGDPSTPAGNGTARPADVRDLIEQARQALAAGSSGRTGTAHLAADDGPQAAPAGSHGLIVLLGVDEVSGEPVIRVCEAATRRPLRDISPASLVRPPRQGGEPGRARAPEAGRVP